MPKVSVIVTVYNVENYLPRCLDSLSAQTLEDIELLLVDDGSTDQSGRICDEYAKANANARVIHKENGGASSARTGAGSSPSETANAASGNVIFLFIITLPSMLGAVLRGPLQALCTINAAGSHLLCEFEK